MGTKMASWNGCIGTGIRGPAMGTSRAYRPKADPG